MDKLPKKPVDQEQKLSDSWYEGKTKQKKQHNIYPEETCSKLWYFT